MTNLNELGDDDIQVLVEALDAWENKDLAGDMLVDIFSMMMGKGDTPEQKAKMEASRLTEKLKRDREKAVRKERSIILKAKLMMLKSQRGIDQIERAIAKA